MGSGCSARSTKGGAEVHLIWFLLVTHLGEVYCVCTTSET
jgi:hypothetical protein